VSDFERRAGTRYTVDTVRELLRRYPRHRFVWLMGADTLPNFHKWRDWRDLARLLPIAVLPRPGYDAAARAARAMGWFAGFVHPARQARQWTEWSPPAIIFLRLPTSPQSATALRALDPDWHHHRHSRVYNAAVPNPRRPLARRP
jgi:nicotinate-nucleotide adenylyltransferase